MSTKQIAARIAVATLLGAAPAGPATAQDAAAVPAAMKDFLGNLWARLRAAMGDRARASAGFSDFIKQQPQHPLVKDAEQALAALR